MKCKLHTKALKKQPLECIIKYISICPFKYQERNNNKQPTYKGSILSMLKMINPDYNVEIHQYTISPTPITIYCSIEILYTYLQSYSVYINQQTRGRKISKPMQNDKSCIKIQKDAIKKNYKEIGVKK